MFALFLMLIGAALVSAQDVTVPSAPPDGTAYELIEVAGGFVRPVFLTHADDGSGRAFIVEQNGRIFVIQDGNVLGTPFLDASDIVSRDANERGLLGLAFHPNYAENGFFYINYTNRSGNTIIARYTVSADNPNVADPDSALNLLQIAQPYANHNGGDLAFGPDGYLYIGMGDGGSAGDPQGYAQNTGELLGKILRIDVDGGEPYAIPEDNPFVNDSSYAPEIWALGVRNPWRFSFDAVTGDLYIGDVGQNQWEEVNFQPAGQGGINYGWNIIEGIHRYSGEPVPDGLTPPFAEYSHADGCSVTGGYVYRGAELPELQGVYFFADYCSGIIWSNYRDAAGTWQTNVFMESGLTISSFGVDEANELYVMNHSGTVAKLVAK
ncbi:MAG: PQQ-dependent sugar dehydrogenase [Anaerolineae bacterium]|nr:PQQ-dependent sugar dehydrogenase [Anaerolineae bacterium]